MSVSLMIELHPGHAPVAAFRDRPMLEGSLTDKPVHAYEAEE